MLQQNNNNNCLDMSHRELLHECKRTNVSFTSALELGAIPLIKGLRAWAVSGGYSKTKKKIGSRGQGSTCQQPSEGREGVGTWSVQGSSAYGHTSDITNNAKRTGVRQGGSGALVTVATFNSTEGGGRQTQTRCLFLKAQGQGGYISAVEDGTRVTSLGSHSIILEGTKDGSSKGHKLSQKGADGDRLLKGKPRAIRKWRKCGKTSQSVEKRRKAHGNLELSDQHCDLPHDQKCMATGTQPVLDKGDDRITKSQEYTSAFVTTEKDVNDLGKGENAQTVPDNMCSFAIEGGNPDEGMTSSQSDICSENDKQPRHGKLDAQEDNAFSTCANRFEANEKDVDDVQNLRSAPLETQFGSLTIKLNTGTCKNEPSINHPLMQTVTEVLVSIQKSQESRPIECLLDRDNLLALEIVDLLTQSDATADTYKQVGAKCNSSENKQKPVKCAPQLCEEFITEKSQLEDQDSNKSSPQGFTASIANITVPTFNSQTNPSPTTTAAIATAIPAARKWEEDEKEEEARGGDVLLLADSDLQSKSKRFEDWDKVATSDGSLDLEEDDNEEEDEFGDFMQADEEQLLMDGINDDQQLAAGESVCTRPTNEKEGASWRSAWIAGQTGNTWVAFGQQTEEQQPGSDDQWWHSTQKPNPPISTLHNVSNVFLEAFSSENSSCEDPRQIPALQNLLQGSAEKSTKRGHRDQSLLDSLQDLERMIGVKYKRAESLSHKLLLKSLHLEQSNFESVRVRLKSGARFSPDLASSNQQLAANAKRRLSYDFNRNVMK